MDIRIIRSRNRRRTVHGRQVNGVLEILAPAHLDDQALQPFIEGIRRRIERRQRGRCLDDRALEERAGRLNDEVFDGRLHWASIRWVTNQDRRFGSCSCREGRIRISHHLAAMPAFVLDYVIVHELAHLLHADHGEGFWRAVNRYPWAERARGYLMAVGLHGDDRDTGPQREGERIEMDRDQPWGSSTSCPSAACPPVAPDGS
ncbi:MAG: M48 family metallopeptidase [Phycisphaerae bacterium]|nr:M48 family metallopeptidase [Phycisphaerae bacterium]